jgi:hypothetical protein
MTPIYVEDPKRQLIDVLRAEGNHFLSVAAALEQAEGPRDVLSALEFLGETDRCDKINALGGKLSVRAIQTQEQEQRRMQGNLEGGESGGDASTVIAPGARRAPKSSRN